MTTPETASAAYCEKHRPNQPRMHLTISTAFESGWIEALASQWVSVEDALPEYGERVFAYVRETKALFVTKRIDTDAAPTDSNNFIYGTTTDNITHWMPIPTLPK